MKAQNHEGEAREQLAQDRQQIGLAEALAGGHEFELGNGVHGVDVIDPLGPVLVALIHTSAEVNLRAKPCSGGA